MTPNRSPNCRFAFSAIALLILFTPAAGLAAPAGEVTHVSGVLMVRKADGTSRILAPKSTVEPGDLLATAGDTYARVKFADGGEITLRPNSQFKIEMFNYDKGVSDGDSAIFSLLKGGLRTITGLVGKRKPNSYEMRTSTATIGIRGTNYGLLLCQGDCQTLRNNFGQVPQDGLHVDVANGIISVTNKGEQVLFSAGQFGYVQSFTTPPTIVPQGQGVTSNTPSFQSGPAGSNAGCVVQ